MTDQKKPRHRSNAYIPLEVVERRTAAADLEVRSANGGKDIEVRGYPIVFDSPAKITDEYGTFTETIRKGSTIGRENDRIGLYLNHDYRGLALACTWNGSVTWREDSRGVFMDATMSGNRQDCNDIAQALADGIADKMSFGFQIGKTGRDSWNAAQTERSITRFGNLSDFSILTVAPAYDATEVGLRDNGSLARELRFVNHIIAEVRVGKKHSAETVAKVHTAIAHLNAAGLNMSTANSHLNELLASDGSGSNPLPSTGDGTIGGNVSGPPNGNGPAIGSVDGAGSRARALAIARKEVKRSKRKRGDSVARALKVHNENERGFSNLV